MRISEKGVTNVIGTIMLVALTILASGSFAYFFLNQNMPETIPRPSISFDNKESGADNLTVVHDGGDQIKNSFTENLSGLDKLKITKNGINQENNLTNVIGDNDTNWEIGERIIISTDLESKDIIKVIHKPTETILEEMEVS